MTDPAPPHCPRCNATIAPNQEYCLECGMRLDRDQRSGSVAPMSAGIGHRQGWAAPWVLPALLGLVIAVLGTAAKPSTTTTPKPTTTAKPPANPASIVWPRGRRGWTIVLISLPQANGLAAANARAAQARRAGLRRVGVLDSGRYASLHPGYYVVFSGVFDSEAEAASALQRARAAFPPAYQREIIP